MTIVSLNCPKCGATVEIDNSRKQSFCSYCGSKFLIKDDKTTIEVDRTNDIANALDLGFFEFENANYSQAYDYARDALELNSKNVNAWKLRTLSLAFLYELDEPQKNELKRSAERYIDLSEDKASAQFSLDETYLNYCIKTLTRLTDTLKNTKGLLLKIKMYEESDEGEEDVDTFGKMQDIHTLREAYSTLAHVSSIRFNVEMSRVQSNEELTKLLNQIIDAYLDVIVALKKRKAVYNHSLIEAEENTIRNNLAQIVKGLPQTEIETIFKRRDEILNPQKSEGCYIATCVYGSYDCPPVWTLRHFRDETLSTFSMGRLFIKLYYATSPTLVKYFGQTNWFKRICKIPLDCLVRLLQNKGFKNTPY